MKYIVEVLSNFGQSDTRTTIFSSLDDVKAALDNYQFHRPGQPIVALYEDEDSSVKALIAVGTSTNTYHILGTIDENSLDEQIITNLSASNVIVDPIDITNLLAESGAGNDDWSGAISKLSGVKRHFGYLGTTSSSWAVDGSNGSYTTKEMSVQQLFEAILNGTQVERDSVAPNINILLGTGGSNFFSDLALNLEDGESQQIRVKIQCENINEIPSDTTFSVSPIGGTSINYNTLLENGGEIIYSTYVTHSSSYEVFRITASNAGGSRSSTAVVCWVNEGDPTPEVSYEVHTDPNYTVDFNTLIDSTYITFSGNCNYNAIYTNSPRGIEINGVPVSYNWSSNLDAWCVKINAASYNLDYDTTYTYRAYITTPDNETIYGEELEFIISEPLDLEWPFIFSAVPSGSGVCNGFIDDSSATSGSYYPNDSVWKIVASSNDGYELDEVMYWLNGAPFTASSHTVELPLTSPVEVSARFRPLGSAPYEEGQYRITYAVFNENVRVPDADRYLYVSCEVPYYLVYPESSFIIFSSEKQGYIWQDISLLSGDAIATPDLQNKSITLTDINSDIVIAIYIRPALTYTVNLRSNPVNAVYSLIINGTEQSTISLYESDPAPILSFIKKNNYLFEGWYIGGEQVSTEPTYTYLGATSTNVDALFTLDPTDPNTALRVKFVGSDDESWNNCYNNINLTKLTIYRKDGINEAPWSSQEASETPGLEFDYYVPCIKSETNGLATQIKIPNGTAIDSVYVYGTNGWIEAPGTPFIALEGTTTEYVWDPQTLESTAILAVNLVEIARTNVS